MKPQIYGLTASASMLLFYAIVVTYFNSFEHAVAQFLSIWPLMVSLIAGFGVQVGLFFYTKERMRVSALTAASSGTVSAGSMVACCAHHISDVLLFSGLSFLAAFANKYQVFFISVGIISNILGSLFMLRMMQKHRIKRMKNPALKILLRYDLGEVLRFSFVAGAALLVAMLLAA